MITLLSACQSWESYSLNSLLEAKLIPPTNTYSISLYAKGEFSCPFELWLLLQGSEYHKIILDGVVDTIVLRRDWYGEELSFKSYTLECIDKEAIVKVDWHTL